LALVSTLASSISAFAALTAAGCVTPAAPTTGPVVAPAQAPTPDVQQTAMASTCARDVLNAAKELDFVCSLFSADLAHVEAGRPAAPKSACVSAAPDCPANANLTIRLLYSPAPAMNRLPIAASIEASGFDTPSASLDIRELRGEAVPMNQQDPHAVPPPMHRGETKLVTLSPEVTAKILALATALRGEPEQASWILCVAPSQDGNEAHDTTILSPDASGVFVQIFYGAEEHAYLRASPFYGQAGRIAALALGFDPPKEDCRPDRRF
jgi:hypothetical protein